MRELKIGFAMSGSYCTYDKVLEVLKDVCREFKSVTPIMSENSAGTDSRFGSAVEFKRKLKEITGNEVITTITDAEPVGPKKLFDVLAVAPCTGNTLAKLTHGVTDTCVTMAVKAHLRNDRPVVLAIATNDGLSANGTNIGNLLNRKNIYFVPFNQDDPEKKPRSLMADFTKLISTIYAAADGKQIQPIIAEK